MSLRLLSSFLTAARTVTTRIVATTAVRNAEKTVVYVDGSCRRNGMRNAKAGYGIWYPGHFIGNKRHMSTSCTGHQSHNRAELEAIGRARQQSLLSRDEHVCIYSDSHFAVRIANMAQDPENHKMLLERYPEYSDLLTLFAPSDHHMKEEYLWASRDTPGLKRADELARAGSKTKNGTKKE